MQLYTFFNSLNPTHYEQSYAFFNSLNPNSPLILLSSNSQLFIFPFKTISLFWSSNPSIATPTIKYVIFNTINFQLLSLPPPLQKLLKWYQIWKVPLRCVYSFLIFSFPLTSIFPLDFQSLWICFLWVANNVITLGLWVATIGLSIIRRVFKN